jgi:hypothetical protein
MIPPVWLTSNYDAAACGITSVERSYAAMTETPARQHPSHSLKSSPFLNEVRRVMRLKRMSRRTEASYLYYILDFIRFHGKRHPCEMGVEEIRVYLSHLATERT